MKTYIAIFILVTSIMLFGMNGYAIDSIHEISENTEMTDVMVENELSLEEMLVLAIEDEYAARSEYETILSIFDVDRPFSNILAAEENHISWLEPLFEKYGIELPNSDVSERIIVPETLNEAYETGVTAEILNIAMYDNFLKQNLPDDVAAVFTNLRNASENHLDAFERQLDQSEQFRNFTGANEMQGNGFGRRSFIKPMQ